MLVFQRHQLKSGNSIDPIRTLEEAAPFPPAALSIVAKITKTSATGALVMKVLEPFRT
jgi:hypothetical protein